MTNSELIANHSMKIEYDDGTPFIEWTCLHDDSENIEETCSLIEGISAIGDETVLHQYADYVPGKEYESGDVYLSWEYEGTDWETGYAEYGIAWEYAPRVV